MWVTKELKELQLINQDKMRFDSGNKAFDKQTNYIGTGNVLANTQYSSYIRSYNNTDKGRVNAGHLQQFDLTPFGRLPMHIKAFIASKTQESSVILYQFHHRRGGKLIVHGWIITAPDNKVLGYFPASSRKKSHMVLQEAIKYIGRGYPIY